jgi:tetratricopeptide (TPR) repeat protein
MAILSQTRDSVRIKQTFEEYNRYRPGVFAWNLYLIAMLNSKGKGTPELLALADSAHRLYSKEPDDSLLLQRKAEIIRFMGSGNTSVEDEAQKLARAQVYYSAGVAAFAKAQSLPALKNKPVYLESARNFIRAGEIITNNYVIYENAGISYFNMGEFSKAIPYFDKVTAMQTSQDGKSEYFKGVAYYNLGNKPEGCKWIGIADKKGYKEAAVILQNNCK